MASDGDGSSPGKKKGGPYEEGVMMGDDGTCVRSKEIDERRILRGESVCGEEDMAKRKEKDGFFQSIFTLFVDGISNCVGYHHVRGRFTQFGRVFLRIC